MPQPFPGRPLRRGSRGPGVEALQRQLITHAGVTLAVDGEFGPETERVVRGFQGHRGFGPDGIVDAVTWALIFRQPLPERRRAKRRRLRQERAERRLQLERARRRERRAALTRRLQLIDAALVRLDAPESREQRIARLRAELTTREQQLAAARGARRRELQQRVDAVKAALRRLTELPLAARAWELAGDCVGIREVGGNNRGAAVERIIRYALGVVPEPWCVDGVIWCYGHAGSVVVKPGYPRAVRMMLVPGVAQTSDPQLGDPVRFTFDHTGLFGGWRRLLLGRYVACPKPLATHLLTREFNTGGAGALTSDGGAGGTDGVYEKVRHRSLVADFLRVGA